MKTYEVNFDGLIGPTHTFTGLAFGNIPSLENKFEVSHPKKAAKEGLNKMRLLHSLGIKQGIIPPQERPDVTELRRRGLEGTDQEIIEKVAKDDIEQLLEVSSASSMWTANAATISPSMDCGDGKLHITPANLKSLNHRAIEAEQTKNFLKNIFPEENGFVHHPVLSEEGQWDEGAANHMRLCPRHADKGIEVFVFGKDDQCARLPKIYPARQSYYASKQNAFSHQLDSEYTIFAQQNPDAIDAGVFHNDVMATGNEHVLFYHEDTFLNTENFEKQLNDKFKDFYSSTPCLIKVTAKQLSLPEAIKCYMFNSQIVTLPEGNMALISPMECHEGDERSLIDDIINADNPIKEVHFVPLNESMANGGGPACLRLRAVVTEEEFEKINNVYLLNDIKIALLDEWINDFYRDELHVDDLKDYYLLEEGRGTLAELTQILNLGKIYSF